MAKSSPIISESENEEAVTSQTAEPVDVQRFSGPEIFEPVTQTQTQAQTLASEFSGAAHFTGAALRAYGVCSAQQKQDELVLEFMPMVHKIVSQVVSYLHPSLTREDLVSAGTIGLIKAARDFDSSQQAEFKTYAYIRVRGAVIDELRNWSFTPTNIKKQFAKAQELLQQMTLEAGKPPSDETLAARLDMPVEKMYQMFETARAKHFLSIHGINDDTPALGDTLASNNTSAPGERLEKEELLKILSQQIQLLPDKQRQIMIMYYSRQLTMKEIAQVMEITESRVSQLHASGLFKLSTRMKQYEYGK